MRSTGLEPARPLRTTSTSGWRVYLFRHERMEPSSGADPDHLPYEGKVTAVCDGKAPAHGLEPRTSRTRTWRSAKLS